MDHQIDIATYLINPPQDPDRLKSIEAKIAEIEKSNLAVETVPKKLLMLEKLHYSYPLIRQEFLNIVHTIPGRIEELHTDYQFRVPYFGLYRPETAGMIISIGIGRKLEYDIDGSILEPDSISLFINPPKEIPNEIYDHYAKNVDIIIGGVNLNQLRSRTVEYNKNGMWISRYSRKALPKSVPKELRSRVKKHVVEFSITSEFHGIIPEEVKEEMSKGAGIFGQVFICSPTTPEDWSFGKPAPRMARDAFLLGVYDKNLYQVCSFSTTSLDEYVNGNFTT